jgi:hypothetical protein
VRPVRRGPEAGWVEALAACGPPVRTLLVEPDEAVVQATVRQLRRVLGDLATQVRATRRSA